MLASWFTEADEMEGITLKAALRGCAIRAASQIQMY
jgi:hypothetical protein